MEARLAQPLEKITVLREKRFNAKTPRETNKDAMKALEISLLSNTVRSRRFEVIKPDKRQNLNLLILAIICVQLMLAFEQPISLRSFL